jgi:hypothetical protein
MAEGAKAVMGESLPARLAAVVVVGLPIIYAVSTTLRQFITLGVGDYLLIGAVTGVVVSLLIREWLWGNRL